MSAENVSEKNKALIRRWFEEVWNQGRMDAIGEMFAKNGISHGLLDDAKLLRGPVVLRRFHTQFRLVFPTIKVVVEDQIAEGDKVATRCSMHTKPSRSRHQFQPPVVLSGVTITRIKDGKIVEAWNNYVNRVVHSEILSPSEGPGCKPAENNFWQPRRRR